MSSDLKITPGQIASTRALKRFCEQHGHASGWLERLGLCLSAMDAQEPPRLREALRPFSRAGMGSFIDWFPSSTLPSEDAEYVETLWNALYGHWREQLLSLIHI